MLTINKLEKIIELEDKLRGEYQEKLDTANEEVQRYKKHQMEHSEERKKLQGTIDQQLETIQDLSKKASNASKFEQRNKELHNRSDNLTGEIATIKQRVKALQKDLSAERDQVKELTQFDPARMRKNLDATKKKLVEKTKANDLLQKSLKEARTEKAELERELEELKAKLAELEVDDEAETEGDAEVVAEADESSAEDSSEDKAA